MKVLENTTLYKCNFCSKYLIRKHAMEAHEFGCYMNPKNQAACSGCVFLKEGNTEVFYEYNDSEGYREIGKTVKTFSCKKLDKKLYPFKVVKKGLLEKYPESFEGQEQMPNSCNHWNYKE